MTLSLYSLHVILLISYKKIPLSYLYTSCTICTHHVLSVHIMYYLYTSCTICPQQVLFLVYMIQVINCCSQGGRRMCSDLSIIYINKYIWPEQQQLGSRWSDLTGEESQLAVLCKNHTKYRMYKIITRE